MNRLEKKMADKVYKDVAERIISESKRNQKKVNKLMQKSLKEWEKKIRKAVIEIIKEESSQNGKG